MTFSFAKAKSLVRETVHSTFSAQGFYLDSSINTPVEIYARWHVKQALVGGPNESEGYAEYYEFVDKIIFKKSDATAIPVKRGGTIWFPGYATGDIFTVDSQTSVPTDGTPVFTLELSQPSNHPSYVTWDVTRK